MNASVRFFRAEDIFLYGDRKTSALRLLIGCFMHHTTKVWIRFSSIGNRTRRSPFGSSQLKKVQSDREPEERTVEANLV